METNLNMISFFGGYWGSSLNAANPTHIGKHIDTMEELFPQIILIFLLLE